MTFDELKQQLIDAGFQWTDPKAPAPKPDPKSDPKPDPKPDPKSDPKPDPKPAEDANAQLIAAIADLKATIQANAVNTFHFDQPPKEQTAEDILGAMLAGAKPDTKK